MVFMSCGTFDESVKDEKIRWRHEALYQNSDSGGEKLLI